MRKRQSRNAYYAQFHKSIAVTCAALGLVIVAVGLILMFNADNEKVRARDVRSALVLLAAPFFALASRQWYKAKRLSVTDACTTMSEDKRPPVLYLRSFQDDASGLKLPGWLLTSRFETRSKTHEERMAETLQEVGPFVAIGRPGESMPELGAHRMYVSDDRWQDEVKRLMAQARLVVLRLGASAGLKWEFAIMSSSVPPERILLYLEPPDKPPDEFWQLLPCGKLPAPRGRYILFAADWTPRAGKNLWRLLHNADLVHITKAMVVKNVFVAALAIVVLSFSIWYGMVGWRLFEP